VAHLPESDQVPLSDMSAVCGSSPFGMFCSCCNIKALPRISWNLRTAYFLSLVHCSMHQPQHLVDPKVSCMIVRMQGRWVLRSKLGVGFLLRRGWTRSAATPAPILFCSKEEDLAVS